MDIDPDNINIEEGYSRKRKFEPEYSELDEINARNKALDSKLEDLRVDNSIRQVPDYIHQGLIYPSMAYGKGSYGRKRGYRRTGGKRMPSASSIARAIGRAQVSAAERAAFWGASGMSVPGVQGSARMNMFGSNWANANPAQRYARRAMRFRGEGGFWDSLKSGLKSVASVAGPIARLIPHPAAQAVGQGLALTGLGAYEHGPVAANEIVNDGQGLSGGVSQQQISVNSASDHGDIYISHTEFVQNIYATTGAGQTSSPFSVVEFPINPGLAWTFPFLSQLAQNFTLYSLEGLVFQYKPQCGESSSQSNSLGQVIFATNYDPNADKFLSAVEMANYDYANSTKPSSGMIHGVETAKSQQALKMSYVRTGSTKRDKIFTDLGTFQVGTEGIPMPANTTLVLGQLWVTYRIRLSRANLYGSLLGQNIAQDEIDIRFLAGVQSPTSVYKETNTLGCTATATLNNVPGDGARPRIILKFPQNISLGSYRCLVATRIDGDDAVTQGNFLVDSVEDGQTFIPGEYLPSSTLRYQVFPETTISNREKAMVFYLTVAAPGLEQAVVNLLWTYPLDIGAGQDFSVSISMSQINQVPSLTLA
jgi:hypothetical protein